MAGVRVVRPLQGIESCKFQPMIRDEPSLHGQQCLSPLPLSPLRHSKKSEKHEDMEVDKQTRTITKEDRSRSVLEAVLDHHQLPPLTPSQHQFVLLQIQRVLHDDGSLHDVSSLNFEPNHHNLSHHVASGFKQQRLPSADQPAEDDEAVFDQNRKKKVLQDLF